MSDVWALVRHPPDGVDAPVEVLGVFPLQPSSELVEEFGPGHVAVPCPYVPAGSTVRVVHTWSCRATVEAGAVERVAEPARLAGASRLVVGDEDEVPVERVVVDDAAGEMEAVVHGRTVAYVTAYATAAERARELATVRAEEIAAEQGGSTP